MSIDLDKSHHIILQVTHHTCNHWIKSLLTAEVLHPPVVGRLHVPGPRAHHVVQLFELLLETAGLVVFRVWNRLFLKCYLCHDFLKGHMWLTTTRFTGLFLSFVQENKNRKIEESNQASKTKPQTFEVQLVLMAGYRHKQIKQVKSHKRFLNWKLIDAISLKV